MLMAAGSSSRSTSRCRIRDSRACSISAISRSAWSMFVEVRPPSVTALSTAAVVNGVMLMVPDDSEADDNAAASVADNGSVSPESRLHAVPIDAAAQQIAEVPACFLVVGSDVDAQGPGVTHVDFALREPAVLCRFLPRQALLSSPFCGDAKEPHLARRDQAERGASRWNINGRWGGRWRFWCWRWWRWTRSAAATRSGQDREHDRQDPAHPFLWRVTAQDGAFVARYRRDPSRTSSGAPGASQELMRRLARQGFAASAGNRTRRSPRRRRTTPRRDRDRGRRTGKWTRASMTIQ